MLPQYFEIAGNHGSFRPAGVMSLDAAVDLIDQGLAFAREQHVSELLVDTRALHGFDPPSLVARFWFIQKWAATAGGAVRMAMVARPEMIDPNKFGVVVARNRGMIADIFVSQATARAWLSLTELIVGSGQTRA
jgi:hypothetical protein